MTIKQSDHVTWLLFSPISLNPSIKVNDRGSLRIDTSQVLPGLALSILEDALRLSRETDQSTVGAWLLTQFQPS